MNCRMRFFVTFHEKIFLAFILVKSLDKRELIVYN